MAMFSYLYYNSYVGAEVGVTVGSVLSSAVQLSRKQQLELWGLLANLLAGIYLPGPPPVPFNKTDIFLAEIWEALANFQQKKFDACWNSGGIINHSQTPTHGCPLFNGQLKVHVRTCTSALCQDDDTQ